MFDPSEDGLESFLRSQALPHVQERAEPDLRVTNAVGIAVFDQLGRDPGERAGTLEESDSGLEASETCGERHALFEDEAGREFRIRGVAWIHAPIACELGERARPKGTVKVNVKVGGQHERRSPAESIVDPGRPEA